MNLQQLYYFRKLAEVQHYTKAAKALYITQPSLSDSIASLEHELSVSLFQKKGRGVQLTKYGQEFYEYVNQALGILEHGIAAVREKSDSVTGTIDIGCIPTLLGDFLPNALDLYHEKCPQVSFNIFHEKSIPVAEGVSAGTYDIGLCSYDDEISIAGRINHSSKTAIVADTPFLKQFDNLKKIHLTDVPKDTRMLYLVYSKKNFITAAVEAFANFMVAHCLNLPPES